MVGSAAAGPGAVDVPPVSARIRSTASTSRLFFALMASWASLTAVSLFMLAHLPGSVASGRD